MSSPGEKCLALLMDPLGQLGQISPAFLTSKQSYLSQISLKPYIVADIGSKSNVIVEVVT